MPPPRRAQRWAVSRPAPATPPRPRPGRAWTAPTPPRSALDSLEAAAVTASPPLRGQDWTATDPAPLEEAMGELLFAAVALARRLRLNPEDALRGRTNRFAERFRALESRARADGADLHDLDAAEWRRRWEESAAAGP